MTVDFIPVPRQYDDRVVTIVENTINEVTEKHSVYDFKLSDVEAYQPTSKLDKNDVIDLIYLSFDIYVDLLSKQEKASNGWNVNYSQSALFVLQTILTQNIKKKLPYSDEDLSHFLFFSNEALGRNIVWIPQNSILSVIEKKYKDQPIHQELLIHIKECIRISEINSHSYGEYKKLEKRAQKLLNRDTGIVLVETHLWSKQMMMDIHAMSAHENLSWKKILHHALTATSSKPSKKWLDEMKTLIRELECEQYKHYLERWLSSITEEKVDKISTENDLPLNDETNRTVIKGLLWSSLVNPHEDINRQITSLGLYCYKKVPGWGAISPKIANVCLYVLGELPGMQGVNSLNEMLKKIKYPSAKKMIEKSLESAAKRNDLSRDDLDELSVARFNLSSEGTQSIAIGDTTALFTVDNASVDLKWCKEDGTTQKSVPAHIKSEYSAETKSIGKELKDIRSALDTQKWRLERLFLRKKPWLFFDWHQRYHAQPLIRSMVGNLIWAFETNNHSQSGIWKDGAFVNVKNEPIPIDENLTRVKLWHPIDADDDEITLWKTYLQDNQIEQPFKQVNREIYRLNTIETKIQAHSTRFASHVVQQHTFDALCKQRGWQYSLQGDFDGSDIASIYIEKWDITAAISVDREDHPLTDSGIYKHVTTDRLYFLKGNNPFLGDQNLPLEQVPCVVVSEIMRDIDLFVSVSGIDEDITWDEDIVI